MKSLHQRFSLTCVCLVLTVFGSLPPDCRPSGPPSSGDAAKEAANPAIQAAAVLYDGIRTETLANGLRVYLKPVPDSPVVTTMLAYKVGSGDEDLDNTGLSHYLEHLMFKGTARLQPGDIDRMTLRNGGENNAYTSEDYTVYHFDFAADRWEAALAVEADRMRNLQIDAKHEFEQEKGAVIEELRRNEDSPWDLEQKAILPLLFSKQGPYGHPVIGEREHVRTATASIIKAHYNRWYHPNNAVLVVCGGFEPDKAMERIRALFGPIPRGPLPERKNAAAVTRRAPVHTSMESKFEVPRLLMGFNTIRTGDPGYHALEVIQALLSGGKTSRLYKELVEGREIATSASSSNSTGRYPGWFAVEVELLTGKDLKEAEDLVLVELKKLQEHPVGDLELKRAKQGILASGIFGRESVHSLADSIARGVTTNDLDFLKSYYPRIAAVTAAEVQAAARTYLDASRRVVVTSAPGKHDKAGASSAPSSSPRRSLPLSIQSQALHSASWRCDNTRLGSLPPGGEGLGWEGAQSSRADTASSTSGGLTKLRDARRVVLDNGLTLLLLENHRLPIFVAEAFVRQVRLREPEKQTGVATLTGLLLDEGTAVHTGQQISQLIEDVGGSLTMAASGGEVQVLSADRRLGLELLFECLLQPSFPQEAFERQKQRLLSQIEDGERQPDAKAQRVFKALVYGSHPYGRPSLGTRATVERLTRQDCALFHRTLFGPENIILAVVGDFDSTQVIEEVKRLTAAQDQKTKSPNPPKPAAPSMPTEFTQKILTMPQAEQLHFYMGHPGVRRTDPNYYKLLVMDYVLGTGPGFTDRLSARLRDREGLAYTVSATITSSATEEPGLFTCYIGTEPKNFARVKQTFLEELTRLRTTLPTSAEVEDAKKYLLGSLPFQLTTNSRVAGHLLAIERFQLGFDHFEKYRQAVAAVTPSDVKAMAEHYLDPKRMILVAAGPLDAAGHALVPGAPPRGGE